MLAVLVAAPGGIALGLSQLKLRRLRRLPMTFGWMAKRPIDDALFEAWLAPGLASAAVRRDLRKYASSSRDARRQLAGATERLNGFEGPVLIAWAQEDRVMPPDHARRLAQLFPHARLIEIPDSYTLVPLDQPTVLANNIRAFMGDDAPATAA
jgi:pimeloyl-ACP methyl ester carboxylesterase